MPLIKSASKTAVGENIKREMQAGKPRRQSIAIALDVQRRAKRAEGGSVPFYVRSEARGLEHSGMIHSPSPGRADKLPMNVRGNSFVIPADVVSGLGQGNSMAGGHALSKMFGMAPGGASMPHPKTVMSIPTRGMMKGRKGFADGGDVDAPPAVPIMASGGEFSVPPEKVHEIGGGDVEHGHRILNSFVKQVRARTIKTLRKLPGPKRS